MRRQAHVAFDRARRLSHLSANAAELLGIDLRIGASAISTNIEAPLPIQGDAGRLAQLFANLLSNPRRQGSGGVPVSAPLAESGLE